MSNKNNYRKPNSLDKQIEEINEWQKNTANPGYFTGTGRVPAGKRNLLKSPIALIIAGIIFAIIPLIILINDFSIETIPGIIVPMIISAVLITGGIMRISKT